MKCKYDKCDNDVVGASAFCCASHRAGQSRRNRTSATSEAQHPTPDKIQAVHDHIASSGKIDGEFAVVDIVRVTRPPCTPEQLTSSCLACKDKPTCSYLHNMNSAVPGDAKYAGVI